MSPRITNEGSFELDGRTFRWAYDEAEMLEVWNWRCGRMYANAGASEIDYSARRMALALVDRSARRPTGT